MTDGIERTGRVALATQGLLYAIVGLLAIQVAAGDRSAHPSQHGALEAVARQPLGKVLLAVVIVGLVAHMGWRLALAVRGEPGGDDDGKSVVKRIANVGRAAVYGGFTLAAVKLIVGAGSSESGSTEKKGTAKLLGLPGGTAIVVVIGLAIVGQGAWNVYRGLSRKFENNLDLESVEEPTRRSVTALGAAGYAARGIAFALVGAFLVRAGLDHDPKQSKGLDGALREVADAAYGPWVLGLIAVGLILFGFYRTLDGRYRKRSEITYA